jgi:hypothetical protein
MASIEELPTEIVQKIYMDCRDIQSVLNLSSSCHLFSGPYHGSMKLKIIERVLETQFGPLYDLIQLITFNSSQPIHLPRRPDMSIDLAARIVRFGSVIEKWETIYPSLRWRDLSEYRRVLRPHEAYRFRRAMYRMWLYGKAYHNTSFLELERPSPVAGVYPDPRITFMRKFSDDELIEMAEVHDVFHEMVSYDLCPSNAMIQRHFSQGFPGQDILYFGTYETYPIASMQWTELQKKVSVLDLPLKWAGEAWGSFEDQCRTVERVLKLLPDELLHFRENLSGKVERSHYLKTFPETFSRNASTFRDAIDALTALRNYYVSTDHGIDGGIVDSIAKVDGEESAATETIESDGSGNKESNDEDSEGEDDTDSKADDDERSDGDKDMGSEVDGDDEFEGVDDYGDFGTAEEVVDEVYNRDLETYYTDENGEGLHVDV